MISEIIDEGYNQNDFSDFMQSRVGELDGTNPNNQEITGAKALDIDHWTFEDLEAAVTDFKDSYNAGIKQEIDPRFVIKVEE